MSGSRPGGARQPDPETREKTARPRRWKVVLLNDDYTTMDFVVEILEGVFRLSPAEAAEIMMKVHKEGRGVAGVYPHDVADTKLRIVHEKSRGAGYPLKGKLEEE